MQVQSQTDMPSADNTHTAGGLKRWALRWHRTLAWLGGMALLLWGISGLLHPLMTTFGPQQATFHGPQRDLSLSESRPLAEILREAGVNQASALRVVVGPQNNLLQLTEGSAQPRRYFRLDSGAEIPGHDRNQAEFLARHYLGAAVQDIAVSRVEFLTDFTADYPAVNRLLPVYRVDFDTADALSAYIYTETNTIAGVTNHFKRTVQTGFRWIHTWDFIPPQADWLRVVLMGAAVASLLALAVSGVAMLVTIRRRKRAPGSRGWHRAASYALALPLIMLSSSGLFHLVQYAAVPAAKNLRLSPPLELDGMKLDLAPAWQSLDSGQAVTTLSVVQSAEGTLLYRLGLAPDTATGPEGAAAIREARFDGIAATGPALYINATTGEAWAPGDRELALQLGERFSGLPREAIQNASLVTRFGMNYDFRNKRLPVWALEYGAPLNSTLFIDTTTALLADKALHAARAEQWSFALLHKWSFLRGFGRDIQNSIIVIVVTACLIFSAGIGLQLWWQKRSRQTRRPTHTTIADGRTSRAST